MALVLHYPSVPNLLISWFPTVASNLSVGVDARSISTDLPASYEQFLPFIRVTRVGGGRALGFDNALVHAEFFGKSYDDVERLANEFDSLIEWNLHSYNDGVGSVLTTQVVSAATWMPWDDQGVTRFLSVYRIQTGALS